VLDIGVLTEVVDVAVDAFVDDVGVVAVVVDVDADVELVVVEVVVVVGAGVVCSEQSCIMEMSSTAISPWRPEPTVARKLTFKVPLTILDPSMNRVAFPHSLPSLCCCPFFFHNVVPPYILTLRDPVSWPYML